MQSNSVDAPEEALSVSFGGTTAAAAPLNRIRAACKSDGAAAPGATRVSPMLSNDKVIELR